MSALERMTTWARMKFKPSKSRSLALEKGKISKQKFTIQGENIPTIEAEGIKCLGK